VTFTSRLRVDPVVERLLAAFGMAMT
jgi:hypothetical protein